MNRRNFLTRLASVLAALPVVGTVFAKSKPKFTEQEILDFHRACRRLMETPEVKAKLLAKLQADMEKEFWLAPVTALKRGSHADDSQLDWLVF